ncbi:hypothetical protein HK405_013835 [Cladochytrium tenue]|nr:hypothetical protein HK405_013835 [Cladochytrium tenue]
MVRFKNRYIVVEVLVDDEQLAVMPSLAGMLSAALRQSAAANFGDLGVADAGAGALAVKYCSPYTHLAILRVSRDRLRDVWAAATLVPQLRPGLRCCLRVVHVGGEPDWRAD